MFEGSKRGDGHTINDVSAVVQHMHIHPHLPDLQ